MVGHGCVRSVVTEKLQEKPLSQILQLAAALPADRLNKFELTLGTSHMADAELMKEFGDQVKSIEEDLTASLLLKEVKRLIRDYKDKLAFLEKQPRTAMPNIQCYRQMVRDLEALPCESAAAGAPESTNTSEEAPPQYTPEDQPPVPMGTGTWGHEAEKMARAVLASEKRRNDALWQEHCNKWKREALKLTLASCKELISSTAQKGKMGLKVQLLPGPKKLAGTSNKYEYFHDIVKVYYDEYFLETSQELVKQGIRVKHGSVAPCMFVTLNWVFPGDAKVIEESALTWKEYDKKQEHQHDAKNIKIPINFNSPEDQLHNVFDDSGDCGHFFSL